MVPKYQQVISFHNLKSLFKNEPITERQLDHNVRSTINLQTSLKHALCSIRIAILSRLSFFVIISILSIVLTIVAVRRRQHVRRDHRRRRRHVGGLRWLDEFWNQLWRIKCTLTNAERSGSESTNSRGNVPSCSMCGMSARCIT